MENRQGNRHRRGSRAIFWIAGAFLALLSAVLIHYRGVRPIVVREYGESAPVAEDYTRRIAELETGETRPAPGLRVLDLKIGGVPTPVLLWVRDTVAPTATGVDREVALGIPLGPDAFVKDLKDADVVRLTFAAVPDFEHESEQDTEIRMEDRSGNRNSVTVHISVRATHPKLTLEAGFDPPTAEDFLLDGVKGTLDRPIEPERMRHVGTIRIGVTTDGGLHSESELTVVDTVAPEAKGTMLLLMPGETAKPEDCIAEASDATELSYAFLIQPDYDARTVQDIAVTVTDEGGNETEVPTQILISGVRPKEIEARNEPLRASDFLNEEGDEIRVPSFIPNEPGTYTIEIRTNGVRQTVAVTVKDTTAPTLSEKALSDEAVFYTEHVYAPEAFFEEEDVSAVSMTWSQEPDWTLTGEQTVFATAEDAYGNRSSLSRTVSLSDDAEAPEIYGVINRICYVNEPIAYGKEVFAEDAVDGRVELSVESEVVTYQEGTYRVVYRAVDQSGNEATRECTFTLIEQTVTEEELRTIARQVTEEIFTPDMVDAEKLKAIFDYVQKQVKYVNGSNRNYTDWRKAAYDGFTYGKGDCYNIYSVTRALLDETDIPYLSVERVKVSPWRTRHFWVHVNVGTGWYVFDPTWTPRHRFNCFMWTKQQCNSSRNYWKYDEIKYPPLATERFDYDAVVAAERQNAQR